MSYCLTSNFLYESSIFTTVNFLLNDVFEVKQDTNSRSLTILFPKGTTYNRLSSIPGFKIINKDN